MHDKRLIGTWKSDEERTFRDYTFKPSVSQKTRKKLRSIFGKLTHTYTRKRLITAFAEVTGTYRYEVVAKDAHSVAIVMRKFRPATKAMAQTIADFPELCGVGHEISHIHFEGDDLFWINVGQIGNLREYFRKMKPLEKNRKEKRRSALE